MLTDQQVRADPGTSAREAGYTGNVGYLEAELVGAVMRAAQGWYTSLKKKEGGDGKGEREKKREKESKPHGAQSKMLREP